MNDRTDEMIEKVDVPLTRPIKYAFKGEQITSQFVTLYAPNSLQLANSTYLKQTFFQAVANSKGEDSKDKKAGKDISELTGADIIMMMMMSDVDMVKFMLAAKELLKSGVAQLDDQQVMKAPLLEALSDEDFELLVGEYLVNFTLASALKKISSLES